MPIVREERSSSIPRSVTKALSILGLFTTERPWMGLTEVAAAAHLPKGTAYRLLLALEADGFVLQDPESRKWGLGFRIVALYNVFRQQASLYQVFTPWMHQLRDDVQETICLVVEDGGDGICVERIEPSQDLLFRSAVGTRVPLHTGASRKLLMAFLPPDRREQIIAEKGLRRLTPATITDPEILRQELAIIRAQGYAVTVGEHNPGIAAVAAPVYDATGLVKASLSVAGPATRLTPEKIRRVLPNLLKTAQAISRQLGYRRET